ncbi:MAG: hypothetical protein OER95_00765, partial [Acidimicrobiia bacterium]|nr:hypothetical protein [Acidimicrobiia bacterium]
VGPDQRTRWGSLMDELVARGRAVRRIDGEPSGRIERWHAAEATVAVEVLLSGVATKHRGNDVFPEQVATTLLRGHLELHSPVTVSQLAAITGLCETLLTVGLLALENEGSAIQGSFSASRSLANSPSTPEPDGPPAGARVEWCSRRLLARMHARSRRTRRRAVEPISPDLFLRFLTRWQHLAPGTQAVGPVGLQRVLEQLQGWEAAVASWEPDLLANRVKDYHQSWIDRLCHDGEIQWLRLSPQAANDPERRGGRVSKATPVSIVHRHDLGWLLAAHRGSVPTPRPTKGAVAEIVAVMDAHGPRFLTELVADTGRLPSDVEGALWEGVARGLFTADGFEAVRHRTAPPGEQRRQARQTRALSRLRRSGVSAAGAGRWSLVPPVADLDPARRDDMVEALADQLLQRWGVIFYDLAAHERLAVPWRDLQWALRRFEDRGLVRGGRFVKGFSGEQFALPEAVEMIDITRRRASKPTGGKGYVEVCGTDPLNLTGVVIPGPRTPARRTEMVRLPC